MDQRTRIRLRKQGVAAILRIVILAALAAIGICSAGCGRKAASPRQAVTGPALAEQGVGEEASAPHNLFLYLDTTVSASDTEANAGRWEDIQQRAARFMRSAKSGSKLELWSTGPAPGNPRLLVEVELQPSHTGDRQRLAVTVRQKMGQCQQSLGAHPPKASGSYILADAYRLAQRAAAFDSKSEIIVSSDAQEWSETLRYTEILRAKKVAPLVAKVLSQMPRLERPPAAVTLVYSPANCREGTLSGADETKMKRFFLDVFAAWGAPRTQVSEPRQITNGVLR